MLVPQHDEAIFCSPPAGEAVELVHRNQELLESDRLDLQGRTLEHLRKWTRDEAIRAAREYTSRLVGREIDDQPLESVIVAGHQPSLFHPGVWVKNFLIGDFASRSSGAALNLVIDNDVAGSTRIRVPAGTSQDPTRASIPFDADYPAMPWEEAQVVHPGIFSSFGERLAEVMSSWGISPVGAEIWPDAVAALKQSPRIGDCLTRARSCLERRWGLANLELPISRLCGLDPFLWFASHLLAHLPRFRTVYNEVLSEYRRFNRIRSHTHPVPELKHDGDWLEAPFWVWRTGERLRRPVMAQQSGGKVLLSDGKATFCRLPLGPAKEACCAVEALRKLDRQGVRIRTRALTTTLFARLCLGDLFVHGVGGAKYDEMTDRIIARFFRIPAPAFVTASATIHLPLTGEKSKNRKTGRHESAAHRIETAAVGSYDVSERDAARLRTLLRDLDYNSDRHLSKGLDPEADELAAEKQRLIAEQSARPADLSPVERRNRGAEHRRSYLRFREINERLAEKTRDQRERVESELATVRRQLDANAVLQDREFSFCLFPADKLRRFMTAVGHASTAE